MNAIILASAPDIKNPAKSGTAYFVNQIFANSMVSNLCKFLGGLTIAVCIILLVLRKFWPNTPLGRSMNAGGGKVMWCIAAIVLGAVLIAPSQILPFFVFLLACLVQIPLDLGANLLGY